MVKQLVFLFLVIGASVTHASVDKQYREVEDDLIGYLNKRSTCDCVQEFGPMKALNFEPGNWLNLFMSIPLNKNGMLVALKYYAAFKGDFYIGGWRRSGGYLSRAWQVQVTCNKEGENYASVTPTEVRAGDFIGVYYPRDTPEGRGVVYYEAADKTPHNIPPNDPLIQADCNAAIFAGDSNTLIPGRNCFVTKRAVALAIVVV